MRHRILQPLRGITLVAALVLSVIATFGSNTQAQAATRHFVGLGVTRDGQGYGLISDAGEVYAFGTVAYRGNPAGFTGGIAGISVTADGQGYAAISGTGQVYAYGTVRYWGNPAGFTTKIVGISVTADGQGYAAISDTGQVYAYGTVQYRGNPAGFTGGIAGISVTADGQGYAAISGTGQVYAYGTVQYRGNGDPGDPDDLRTRIRNQAYAELARAFKEVNGNNCNPYSYYMGRGSVSCPPQQRSEEWCSDFASYVWKQAGGNVDGINGLADSFRTWAINRGTWKPGWSNNPQAGDAIVYGGAGHVGIVVDVDTTEHIRVIWGNVSNAVGGPWINPRTDVRNGGSVRGYAPPGS
jgi:hypothetical protein